ncbi:MAG: benzoate/H(+) symporter BenE family transporter [Bauldia sp.]
MPASGGSLLQPVSAGILAAFVGFASSFTIILAGLTAVGASPAEAASGLFAASLGLGLLSIVLSFRYRMPITVAWSTPGAALLISTGASAGGFSAAVGAFLAAAVLMILAGLWRPFGRVVAAIPMPLANAMLAGILLELCLAPVRAAGEMPLLALPIIVVWAVALRFARLYAVPLAVIVTVAVIGFATPLPPASLLAVWPLPIFVMPTFSPGALVSIAVPLFLVTMASQNVPGLAVFNANGFKPPVGPLFLSTGIGSAAIAFFGGHAINLAAITAALCAGPDAHPDPARRWIASVVCGATYFVLAAGAGFAAAFVVASPPLLIQAVAGLALLATLASVASAALAHQEDRLPAVVTFVTTASGIVVLGIGSAFWGLLAGGALMALLRTPHR